MKDILELTTHCIRCGFCLEACPTFTTTASETDSPRGRIYLVRSAEEGKLKWQEDVRESLDRCLGCRACETACPSGVEYGLILEMARDKLEDEKGQLAKSLLLKTTTTPALLKLSGLLPGQRVPGVLSKMLSGQAPEADKPIPQRGQLPKWDETQLPPVKGEVYFLEGCAMSVLYKRVNEASKRLLRRVGYTVKELKGCCGALHAHNGHGGEARMMGIELVASTARGLPFVVNSAGCGSTMKELGNQFQMPGVIDFSSRVFDLSEFLLQNGLPEQLAKAPGITQRVTYHDACHLAHGQKIRNEPRELIKAIPGIDYVELPEADTCCGSAGIYNVTQPVLARQLLERKYQHIRETNALLVATGNPGCHAWIAQAAREHGQYVQVMHTAELLESAFNQIEQ